MGRRTIVGALLAAALLVAGCEVPPPEGDYPLRYRDMTFSVQETPDQVYGEVDGQRLQLDLYAPAGDRATKRPVMLWMHGGGFKFGSRRDGMMVELARRFARRGYVAVSISYRLLAAEACGGEASVTSCTPAVMAAADDNVSWLVQHGFIAGLRDVRGAGHVPSAYLDDMDEQARNFVYRVTAAWGADQSPSGS